MTPRVAPSLLFSMLALFALPSLADFSREAIPARLDGRANSAVTHANWDDGGAISRYAYQRTSEFFPAALIPRNGAIAPLPSAPDARVANWIVSESDAGPVALAAHVENSLADGLIVLHRGQVVFEAYPRMDPENHHLIFSVSKVFVGTLVAKLEDRGVVDIDLGIEVYLPELTDTGWAGVTVRDVLEMAAGMEGAESGDSYSDPMHHHYMMEASLGWLPSVPEHPQSVRDGDTWTYLASLKRVEEPGTRRVYASVNTALLSWLIETVTGKSLTQLLSAEIIGPMGAQNDALITVSRRGLPLAFGGMQMTLRDLARFGLLFTPSAQSDVISPAMLKRMQNDGSPATFGAQPDDWEQHGAYQWDAVSREGDLMKGGFGNQYLFVSPSRDVVVAWVGVNSDLEDEDEVDLPLQRMMAELFPRVIP